MDGRRRHTQDELTGEELELVLGYRRGTELERRVLLQIARESLKYDRHGEHVGKVRVVDRNGRRM